MNLWLELSKNLGLWVCHIANAHIHTNGGKKKRLAVKAGLKHFTTKQLDLSWTTAVAVRWWAGDAQRKNTNLARPKKKTCFSSVSHKAWPKPKNTPAYASKAVLLFLSNARFNFFPFSCFVTRISPRCTRGHLKIYFWQSRRKTKPIGILKFCTKKEKPKISSPGLIPLFHRYHAQCSARGVEVQPPGFVRFLHLNHILAFYGDRLPGSKRNLSFNAWACMPPPWRF